MTAAAKSASDAPCTLLAWDTEFWGVPIAQVDGDALTAEVLPAIDRWCDDNEIACVYLLARSDDPATTRVAEDGGFRSVDIRVTLACELETPLDVSGAEGIREPQPSDRDEIARLARVSYRFTRFYNDEHFPDDRCDELYENWILASVDGLADKVLVAEREGSIVGYISCHLGERSRGRLGLTAVEQGERGSGLGRALLLGALEWMRSNGTRHVSVATQGRNWVTQRMLQRAGFVTEKTEVWYHKWYRPGALTGR